MKTIRQHKAANLQLTTRGSTQGSAAHLASYIFKVKMYVKFVVVFCNIGDHYNLIFDWIL